jgi:hypothetical protein
MLKRIVHVVGIVIALVLGVLPDISTFVAEVLPNHPTALKWIALAIAFVTRIDVLWKKIEPAIDAISKDAAKIGGVLLLGCALAFSGCQNCGGGNTPRDPFYEVIVDCAKTNPQSSAAGTAVLNCLAGAATADYGACLSGLLTMGHWTVDEIACLVRYYGAEASNKLNALPANAAPDAADQTVAANAKAWIVAHKVGYR